MTFFSLTLILIALVTFVAGQLILKRAMEFAGRSSFRNPRFIWLLSAGICSMAAIVLKEKLTLQLAIGALLISAGVALVSLS